MEFYLMNNKLKLLKNESALLDESAKHLNYSFEKCKLIITKADYTNEDLESLEALTSRFARTSDILLQKIFRLIDEIELESFGSIIDRINRAEKRNLVEKGEILKEIRSLRNEIAHEYIPEELKLIYKEALSLTPVLLDVVKQTQEYLNKIVNDKLDEE